MDTKGIGCGIWPVILTDKEFLNCCAWHDIAYSQGSWHQQNLTRKEVDRRFLSYMLESAGSSMSKARAYLYYGFARVLGVLFWEGKER